MTKAQALSKPRKKPKQERSGETVQALMEATAHILLNGGYEQISTNRIAEKAGVSIGSLYQFFPNKESLLVALYEKHEMEIIHILQDKLAKSADVPLAKLIRELVGAMIESHSHQPRLHQILHEQVPHLSSKVALEKVAIDLVAKTLKERKNELCCKNPGLSAFVIVHAVESITHKAVTQRNEFITTKDLADEITRLVLNYLKKE